MDIKAIFDRIKEAGAELTVELLADGPTPSIKVAPADLLALMKLLKIDVELSFDCLMCQTGSHFLEEGEEAAHIRLYYHLLSYRLQHQLVVEAWVPETDAEVDTVETVWKAANWLERETWDLLGVNFKGHSDLRRLMNPDDWEGHPLRKDYQFPTSYHDIDNRPSEISESFKLS